MLFFPSVVHRIYVLVSKDNILTTSSVGIYVLIRKLLHSRLSSQQYLVNCHSSVYNHIPDLLFSLSQESVSAYAYTTSFLSWYFIRLTSILSSNSAMLADGFFLIEDRELKTISLIVTPVSFHMPQFILLWRILVKIFPLVLPKYLKELVLTFAILLANFANEICPFQPFPFSFSDICFVNDISCNLFSHCIFEISLV